MINTENVMTTAITAIKEITKIAIEAIKSMNIESETTTAVVADTSTKEPTTAGDIAGLTTKSPRNFTDYNTNIMLTKLAAYEYLDKKDKISAIYKIIQCAIENECAYIKKNTSRDTTAKNITGTIIGHGDTVIQIAAYCYHDKIKIKIYRNESDAIIDADLYSGACRINGKCDDAVIVSLKNEYVHFKNFYFILESIIAFIIK